MFTTSVYGGGMSGWTSERKESGYVVKIDMNTVYK